MMSIQSTITGEAKIVGGSVSLKYLSKDGEAELQVEQREGRIQHLILDDSREHEFLISIENPFSRPDAHYRDVEPVEKSEDFFVYQLSKESWEKLANTQDMEVVRR